MVELSGSVFDNQGTAINGAAISVFNRNTVACAVTTTTTNACGFWTRSAIAEGRYDVQITCGSSVSRIKYDDEIQVLELETAVFKIRNPADTFVYDILPAAIGANRTLTLPLITGTDTLAALGLAQTFTADQTLNDNVNLTLGTGGDVDLDYNGTDLVLNLTVVGSGDFVVNGGSIEFDDNEGLTLGTGKDATFRYDGTNLTISPAAVGVGDLIISGADAEFDDNQGVTLGTGKDATIRYDGTDLIISPAAVGAGDICIVGADIEFADNQGVTLGTGKDATLRYDGTNVLLNPDAVGCGNFTIQGNIIVSDIAGMVIGHTTQVALSSVLSELEVLGTGNADSSASVGRWSACGLGSIFFMGKSRNACIGSFTIVQDNDIIGSFIFNADDGVDLNTQIVRIRGEVDDACPAADAIGGALTFSTATTAGTLTEAVRIANNQTVTFAGSAEFNNGQCIKVGATTARACTEPTNALTLFNGTVPVGTLVNGATIYTKDVSCSAELHVMDEAGNETLLSPHDPATGEWVFDSRSSVTGKGIHVRMEEMMKRLCEEFGWGLVTEYPSNCC